MDWGNGGVLNGLLAPARFLSGARLQHSRRRMSFRREWTRSTPSQIVFETTLRLAAAVVKIGRKRLLLGGAALCKLPTPLSVGLNYCTAALLALLE